MKSIDLAGLSLLIVEDESLLCRQIASYLERLRVDVTAVGTLRGARKLVEDLAFDFAFLDVNLPDGFGTELLKEKRFPTTTGVIVMTADGNIAGAVEAMKLGALDYLVKPFDPAELPLVIQRAQRARQNVRLDEHRRQAVSPSSFFFGAALGTLEAQLQKILASDRRMMAELPPILIQGETGTGKTTDRTLFA